MAVSTRASIPPSALVAIGGDGKIFINGSLVGLTGSKRALLAFLIKRMNSIVTKKEMFDHLERAGFSSRTEKDLWNYLHAIRRAVAVRKAKSSLVLWFITDKGYMLASIASELLPLYQTLGLPHPGGRWIPERKKLVVEAIAQNKLTLEEAVNTYPNTDKEEIIGWMARYERYGQVGLKTLFRPDRV